MYNSRKARHHDVISDVTKLLLLLLLAAMCHLLRSTRRDTGGPHPVRLYQLAPYVTGNPQNSRKLWSTAALSTEFHVTDFPLNGNGATKKQPKKLKMRENRNTRVEIKNARL